MKKYISFLLLLLAVTTTLNVEAKNRGVISGHVLNIENKEHLPYVTVVIDGTTIGTTTDATGHYRLQNLPEGDYTMIASFTGYKSEEKSVAIKKNSDFKVDFELSEQPLNVNELVVTSNRNMTDKKLSSTIVNVASAKLFESVASSNLAESINFQSGLRVENSCSNCGAMQLRINGLEGQYSQVLLDSRAIYSSLAAVYGLEQIPVSMIERVEVIRGGGSALFGSSAIGGVVNIITKEPVRNSVTLSNNTGFVSGGGKDIATSINGSFVTADNKAGVYIFGMIKNRDAYDRNDDGFSDVPEMESETVGFRSYYKTSNYSKLTAEYHHINEYRRGGDNLDLPAHEAEIAEMLRHKIDGGGLNFDYFSPNSHHKFSIYTSAQAISRDSYFGAGQDLNAYGTTTDKTVVAGGQYSYNFDKCIFMPATLTAGTEYNYNTLYDQFIGLGRELEQDTHTYGLFLQNEWSNEKLNFLIGGRVDKHNLMDKVVISPRANLRYSPIEAVGLRASYSSGYRAPQAYNEDLHIEAVGGEVSLIELSPDLKPEYSHSISGSADLYKTFGRLQANLLVEGFYTKLNNVFVLEQIGHDSNGNLLLQRRNGTGATIKGITTELKMGISNTFDLQVGYTYQQSRYTEAESWSDDVEATTIMPRSPDNYGYITANYDVTKNFRASIFGNYTGKMVVQHAAGYIDTDCEEITNSFWDMGVKVAYNFPITTLFNVELSAGVKNMLDSFQNDIDKGGDKDAGYIYGPTMPRQFFFGVKFSY